jgi:hypothetical protein
MAWKKVSLITDLAWGNPLRASFTDTVIVGTVHSIDARANSVRLVVGGTHIDVDADEWELEAPFTSFWDVMSEADVGTTATPKPNSGIISMGPFIRTAHPDKPVLNATSLNRVDAKSTIGEFPANSFTWAEPLSFNPL